MVTIGSCIISVPSVWEQNQTNIRRYVQEATARKYPDTNLSNMEESMEIKTECCQDQDWEGELNELGEHLHITFSMELD